MPACPGREEIADHYIGFVDFADPSAFPNVDVYAEKGSGIDTVVGIGLDDLSVGQVLDGSNPLFTRDGDINQEDITNDAVGVWSAMPCFHFSLTDNPGVDHFALPSAPAVLSPATRRHRAPTLALQLGRVREQLAQPLVRFELLFHRTDHELLRGLLHLSS